MTKQHRSANAQSPVATPARPPMPSRGPGRLGVTRGDRARDRRLADAMWANAAGHNDDRDDESRYSLQLQGLENDDDSSSDY